MKYNRDTIIDALEHCARLDDDNFPMPNCIECPVVSDCKRCYSRIPYEMIRPLLELLKEQQPKKGHWQPYKYGDDTWHQCSVCGIADKYINIIKRDRYPDYRMVSKRNFCPICGADMREDGEQDG